MLGAIERLYREARIALFGHHVGRPGASFSFRKNFSEDDVRVHFDLVRLALSLPQVNQS